MSIVRYSEEHNISETGYFRLQVKGWETPTLLGPLERADLNHWATYVSTSTAIYLNKLTLLNASIPRFTNAQFTNFRATANRVNWCLFFT
jgi:hypothetical protein